MKQLTLNDAKNVVIGCGAKPLFKEYINSYTNYLVKCSCGNEDKIKFSTLGRNLKKNPEYKYRCSKCRNVGRPVHSIEKIKRDFITCEAEPLFKEYKSLRDKLEYRCKCGNVSFTTCEQFYMHFKKYDEYKLKCQSCVCKDARRDETSNFFDKIIKPYFIEKGIKLISIEYNNNHTPLKFVCSCGKESYVTWGSLKNNGCLKCKDCQLMDRPRGENHPDWNPMLLDSDRLKTRYGRGRIEKIWESYVLAIHNYTCVISGQKGGALSAHHLNAWARNLDKRLQLNNGVCISKKLHEEFHNTYGMKRGDNTVNQFKEFYKNKIGLEYKEKNIIIDFIEETPYPSFILNRKRKFESVGKKYISFFIPEIRLKKEIVLSMIRYKLGEIKKRFFARNLKVIKIDEFLRVKVFLNENHIQGSTVSSLNFALVDQDEIISLMSFTKSNDESDSYILQRFCSKVNSVVVGGASKLFNYFIKEFKPKKVITYGDIRFSELTPTNSIYLKLGFKYIHSSKPNYWYTKDGINLIFRRKFQKHKLSKIFNKEFDSSLTEREIMLSEGYQRLYDCGNHAYIYEK